LSEGENGQQDRGRDEEEFMQVIVVAGAARPSYGATL
jgi:hypothetical protein